MSIEIPLAALAAQAFSVQLGGKSCHIRVYQKRTGLFVDLSVNDRRVLSGILCKDRTWIVRGAHFGFPGDLTFIDTQGNSDPDYSGLGTRFRLIWSA